MYYGYPSSYDYPGGYPPPITTPSEADNVVDGLDNVVDGVDEVTD